MLLLRLIFDALCLDQAINGSGNSSVLDEGVVLVDKFFIPGIGTLGEGSMNVSMNVSGHALQSVNV